MFRHFPNDRAASVPVASIIVGYPKAPPPAVPRKAAEVRWVG
jgi:hypothetical protein